MNTFRFYACCSCHAEYNAEDIKLCDNCEERYCPECAERLIVQSGCLREMPDRMLCAWCMEMLEEYCDEQHKDCFVEQGLLVT
jgi:hypothetical protein